MQAPGPAFAAMRRPATELAASMPCRRGLDGCRRRPPCLGCLHDGSDSGPDLARARTGGFRIRPAIRMVGVYGATMPAFFALAGYAAAAVLEVKGTRGYALDRARRIGLPFLVGAPGDPGSHDSHLDARPLPRRPLRRCRIAGDQLRRGQIQANRLGPAHLWFLAYLIPMLILLGVGQSWRRERPRLFHGVLSHSCSPLTPFILAIPTTLILWLGHWWNGVDPILDLRNSFLINPIRWLHHSLFFIAGLGWHSGRTGLPALTRGSLPWMFLAGSVIALLVRVRWLPLDLAASLTGWAAWASVASASLFGWLTLYGSLGVCGPLARYGGRAIKYLSDSSYWVYLTHFPVVGLVQADLFLVSVPSHAKFLLALAIGLAWSLLTYEACVRRTWIGRWLRGGTPRVPSVPRPVYLDRDEVEVASRTMA